MRRHNILLLVSYLAIIAAIFYVGYRFLEHRIATYHSEQQNRAARTLIRDVKTLIAEKRNATQAIALSLAQNLALKDTFGQEQDLQRLTRGFSLRLKEETDFKNVWVQLIDRDGISVSRSWSEITGDDLSAVRGDVKSMIAHPRIQSSISVGRFDLSFKSMVPLFDAESQFAGILEVITHFNSIAEKIKTKGYEPVILAEQRFKPQLTHPFSRKFAGEYYVANRNADDRLLELIERNGLKHFTSFHDPYVVDDQTGWFTVHYTLFDGDELPMAHFLMFRHADTIGNSAVEEIRLRAYLVMLLAILTVSFGFYIIAVHGGVPEGLRQRRRTLGFILGFIVVSSAYYAILNWTHHDHAKSYLETQNEMYLKQYQLVLEKNRALAKLTYDTLLNRDDVRQLIATAFESPGLRAEVRSELEALLRPEYERLKALGVRQLHFHLPNNESLLRMHRPALYGDNLEKIRETVAWVNAHQRPISGFEEGKVYNGFRYVYPLFDTGPEGERRHIGSVELSYSAHAIAREFTASGTKIGFLVSTDLVARNVLPDEQDNYVPSDLEGYAYDRRVKERLENGYSQLDFGRLDREYFRKHRTQIERGEIVSVPSLDDRELFTFLPIRHPITDKVAALFVLQNENSVPADLKIQFIGMMIAGITTILLGFFFVYREFVTRQRLERSSHKLQRTLDAQKALVIISDGERIVDCNKKFLEFFGYETLPAFQLQHQCICDFFETDDHFFHTGKVPEGVNWIEALKMLPPKEHLVSMRSVNGEAHTFSISQNRFDDDYIVSFADISETMREHFSLEVRASRDKLTGAYNREYFDSNIEILFDEAKRRESRMGFVLFDIDHFKQVNDRYGHNRGDEVLVTLVERVRTAIRHEDLLIRWGGEEFLLIVSTDRLEHLSLLAEHIREQIAELPFETVGTVTCSFGVTLREADERAEMTIERADRALYSAKAAGRNRVVTVDDTADAGGA